MAARKRTWTPEVVRQKIQASMITNRLIDHTLGKVEMSASQVTAGLGLLKKIVPDLSATELSGSIEHNIVSSEPMNADDWSESYTDSVGSTARTTESTH